MTEIFVILQFLNCRKVRNLFTGRLVACVATDLIRNCFPLKAVGAVKQVLESLYFNAEKQRRYLLWSNIALIVQVEVVFKRLAVM